ncbi:MAG TPA: hypothetical protein VEO95_07505, partial [Chthoniobacteraceae bacterium]|nr:hypothetical protein [Chthoniobacteraceae bacterium]
MCRSGAFFFGLILLLAAGARALEVRETLWGFDGRVVPGRMNPVSLLLANPGNSNFDGVAKLRETAGIGGQSGAPFVQPIFLGPQSERWVQFEVFVSMGYEDFVLKWGRGAKDEFNLPHPTLGPPARVLLGDPANPFAAGGSLKNFPDALFPTTVSATDALDGVVLDYAPRWEPARREAFVDWLRRGATVIVLPSTNGEFPQFTEQLAVLNIAGDSAHVGAGTVLRVRAARREAGERLFEEHGFPLLELAKPKAAIVYNLEQTLFSRLAQLTRPNLRWSLLSALTVLYILVIGPAHYRWGRRLDYRVSIGAFVGCVGIFGIVFAVVGRRGNGEEQTVHSLAIARPIEPGRHDVTQWVSAFATRGDIYALTHAAPSNLYAAVSNEPVNGQIMNGRGGQFIADIPLFSSRQFLHRAVMQGDDTSVTVGKWQDENSLLTALVLKTGAAFPREIVEAVARFQDRFYRLKKNGDRLTISDVEPGQRFEDFLPQKTVQ